MRSAPVALGPTGQDRIGHGEGGRAPGAKEQERPDGHREGAPGQRPADDLPHHLDRQDAVDRGRPVRQPVGGEVQRREHQDEDDRDHSACRAGSPTHRTGRIQDLVKPPPVRPRPSGACRLESSPEEGPDVILGTDAAPWVLQRSDSTRPVAIWRRKPRLLGIAPSHWVSGGEEDDGRRPPSSVVRLAILRCAHPGNAKQDGGTLGPASWTGPRSSRSAAGRQGPIGADGSGIAIRG